MVWGLYTRAVIGTAQSTPVSLHLGQNICLCLPVTSETKIRMSSFLTFSSLTTVTSIDIRYRHLLTGLHYLTTSVTRSCQTNTGSNSFQNGRQFRFMKSKRHVVD